MGVILQLNKLHSPLLNLAYGCFEPNLVKSSTVVLEKKMKMGKVYRLTDFYGKTDGQTDEGLQETRESSFEVSTHVSQKNRISPNMLLNLQDLNR